MTEIRLTNSSSLGTYFITPGDDADDMGWYLEDAIGNFYGTGTDEVSAFGLTSVKPATVRSSVVLTFCINYNQCQPGRWPCECPPTTLRTGRSVRPDCHPDLRDGEGLVGTTRTNTRRPGTCSMPSTSRWW